MPHVHPNIFVICNFSLIEDVAKEVDPILCLFEFKFEVIMKKKG